MAATSRQRRSKHNAPATLYFTQSRNEEGVRQLCVFVECHMSSLRVGPIWSHTDAAIKRALATLTEKCDCPASYHHTAEVQGKRVVNCRRPVV